MLTAEYIRSRLDYDPATGVFRWRAQSGTTRYGRSWNTRWVGRKAGCVDSDGYVYLQISRRPWRAHVLAWLYVTGEWPATEIDHKDRNKQNNRFSNLRSASRSANNANRGAWNASGAKGVRWRNDCQKWQAEIRKNGKTQHLGYFENKAAAAEAYAVSAYLCFGEFIDADTWARFPFK